MMSTWFRHFTSHAVYSCTVHFRVYREYQVAWDILAESAWIKANTVNSFPTRAVLLPSLISTDLRCFFKESFMGCPSLVCKSMKAIKNIECARDYLYTFIRYTTKNCENSKSYIYPGFIPSLNLQLNKHRFKNLNCWYCSSTQRKHS